MEAGASISNFLDTFFCCVVEKNKLCEDMVAEHMLVYICSGEMKLVSSDKEFSLSKGDSCFIMRNHLVRKVKQPKDGEPFKGLFLQFKVPFLKRMMSIRNLAMPVEHSQLLEKQACVMLDNNSFIKNMFASFEHYFDTKQYPSKDLLEDRMYEAVLALLQMKPGLAPVIFNFAQPWKTDLVDFMNRNFKCNLSIEEFAHFSGRSLSSFKKDFAQTFNLTPSRWIVKRRLIEAKKLMEQSGKKPVEVYLEVGFKNLSHFSTAFKKEFGFPPSDVKHE